MSKNYMDKPIANDKFPETEVIVEDFTLDFYKCEILQSRKRQKNESEISINNKNLLISVPRDIIIDKNKNTKITEKKHNVNLPIPDINMTSPKSNINKSNSKQKFEKIPKSPIKDVLTNSPQINNRKNGEVISPTNTEKIYSNNQEFSHKKTSNEDYLRINQYNKEEKLFLDRYEKFINKEQFKNIISKSDIKNTHNHNHKLLQLYKFIKANGGYRKVILDNKFAMFVNENPAFKTVKDAKLFYNKHLSHFVLYENNKDIDLEELAMFDEKNINEIPVIMCPRDINQINNALTSCFDHKMVILRGFYEAFNIDETLFSVSEIQTEFHSKIGLLNSIDQSSIGFKKKDKKFQEGSKESKAYSLDNKYLPKIKAELSSKISEKISSLSKNDTLRYLKKPIINTPCTTLTNEDSIFGGKEEQSRFIYFHMNHGPGENIWYGVDSNEAIKMRKIVMNQHNIDIYSDDSDWFVETDFFMKNGINMFYGKQIKGDILFLGNGVFHWHKTVKINISSSWNFCPKTSEQFKHSLEKELINKELNQKSSFSLSKLLFELVDNEIETLENEMIQYTKEWLKPKIIMNMEILSKIKIYKLFGNAKIQESSRINAENCIKCNGELFILGGYYIHNPSYIFCLICLENLFLNDKREIVIFYNYNENKLKNFLSKLNFNPKFLDSSSNTLKAKEPNNTKKKLFKSKIFDPRNISFDSEQILDKYRPEIFQLLEMNLDQDYDSPLNMEREKIDFNEFNLKLIKDPRFSPSDPFLYDVLGNMSNGIGEKTYFNDFKKSPRHQYSDDNIIYSNINKRETNLLKRNSDTLGNTDISLLFNNKTLIESKFDLKKQFGSEDNINENINVPVNSVDKKQAFGNSSLITTDTNQINYPNNNKKDDEHIKTFIKGEIRSCLKVLNELRTREAKKIKVYKGDPVIISKISILKKYLNRAEIVNEYKLEKFVKDIKNNMDLIEPYRNIFSLIYEEFFLNKN